MATRLTQAQLAKRRAQQAKLRVQRERLIAETKRRRRRELIKSIKLIFILTGLLITVVGAFVLLNGAWSLVDPMMNRR